MLSFRLIDPGGTMNRQKPTRRAVWQWGVLLTLVIGAATVFGQGQVRDDAARVTIGSTDEEPLGLGGGIDANLVRRGGDDFKSPQAAEQFKLRQEALRQRLAGKGSGKIHEVARGQYVELGLERKDRIFVIIAEYGDGVGIASPALSGISGPRHNQIPQPDRDLDNNTIWQADYDRVHYEEMYFTKMRKFYEVQSSGRYSIDGSVTEWVRVPFNGPRYGANAMGDAGAWTLIADAINIWTANQLASGKTLDEVKAYLQQFDTWDRYDYDHDGNFDEPDGYIDHMQIVHSGAGEETGGSTLGADAIWSHRWFAFYNWRTFTGPAYNKYGGLEFGGGWGANPTGSTAGSANAAVGPTSANSMTAHPPTPTGIWVGDYTIQPENGGLGVFAHEYGHDLGLPDHYDTNGGSNGYGFWNIMASGSYLGDGLEDIGSNPGHTVAWDKLQLGWLNYELAQAGRFSSHRVGPAETNTKQAQAVIVSLPVDSNVFYLYSPAVGSLAFGAKAYWGGKGDLIDNTMTTLATVPAGSPAYIYMQLNYQTESGWDYGYVSVSTDNGATWTNLVGQYLSNPATQVWSALTTASNPNGKNLGNGFTGSSNSAWRNARFNATAFAGQNVLVRIRYKTDDVVNLKGIMADQIAIGAFTDGAEDGSGAWTLDGFKITSGVERSEAAHYYIAEFRQYRDYDHGLQTGPYSFGDAARPNWVYHYPYQDGLLVSYWDAGEANDNTSQHPGEGLSLPIDAHPEPLIRTGTWPSGQTFASAWSATVQTHDATFGLEPTDGLYLPFVGTFSGQRLQFYFSGPSLPAASEFNDANAYWYPAIAANSVIVPNTGTTIRVVNTSAQGNFMQVHVVPAK
jgi:immune inhibitor A